MSHSEERFRAILEHAPVMIDAFEPDGSVVIWNRECERRLGWTAREVDAMRDPLAVFYPDPQKRAEVFTSIERADGQFREYEVLAKDGSVRIQRWADFALPNGSRISVGYDVTEQHEVEEKLRQAQKLQALGTLSAGIAHDFNNLLTIISVSGVLAQQDLGEAPESVARSLEDILVAADRGADLVRRLMSFGRRDSLRLRPFVLDEALTRFVPTLRRVVPESVELDVSLDAPGIVVLADPVAIEQVVLNLVTNACDAIDGRGKISMTTRAPSGNELVLEVQDWGVGMATEVRDRVFEPFFTTKEPGKGTGLGLPMVYGLVSQHEGTVHVESEPERGTTVTVRLPIPRDTEAQESPAQAKPSARGGQGETVLVVEDDQAVAMAMSRCLQRAGYVVLTASNAQEALATLAGQPDVDLVLSDVIMPKMGGEELRDRMRSGPHADVPIAFISGYSAELSADSLLLRKPWTPAELTAFVRRCLDAK